VLFLVFSFVFVFLRQVLLIQQSVFELQYSPAGLKFSILFLLLPKYWDYRHVLLYMAENDSGFWIFTIIYQEMSFRNSLPFEWSQKTINFNLKCCSQCSSFILHQKIGHCSCGSHEINHFCCADPPLIMLASSAPI
jgi:hypothetical protein